MASMRKIKKKIVKIFWSEFKNNLVQMVLGPSEKGPSDKVVQIKEYGCQGAWLVSPILLLGKYCKGDKLTVTWD